MVRVVQRSERFAPARYGTITWIESDSTPMQRVAYLHKPEMHSLIGGSFEFITEDRGTLSEDALVARVFGAG